MAQSTGCPTLNLNSLDVDVAQTSAGAVTWGLRVGSMAYASDTLTGVFLPDAVEVHEAVMAICVGSPSTANTSIVAVGFATVRPTRPSALGPMLALAI